MWCHIICRSCPLADHKNIIQSGGGGGSSSSSSSSSSSNLFQFAMYWRVELKQKCKGIEYNNNDNYNKSQLIRRPNIINPWNKICGKDSNGEIPLFCGIRK